MVAFLILLRPLIWWGLELKADVAAISAIAAEIEAAREEGSGGLDKVDGGPYRGRLGDAYRSVTEAAVEQVDQPPVPGRSTERSQAPMARILIVVVLLLLFARRIRRAATASGDGAEAASPSSASSSSASSSTSFFEHGQFDVSCIACRFCSRHAKDLSPKQAAEAAKQANAILRSGGGGGRRYRDGHQTRKMSTAYIATKKEK